MQKIQKALISCTDKTGIEELGRFLVSQNVQILSTGGTARVLKEAGVTVTEVSDYTGFPEMLNGRVKTLHPKIHGGLLGLRDDESHQKQMADNNIEPIDLVVVNLYAFEKTIHNSQTTIHEAIEQIDIGGPSMLRSAAKNYRDVTVVTDPGDYTRLIEQIKETGNTSKEFRFELACKVFQKTAAYDAAISQYLGKKFSKSDAPCESLKDDIHLNLKKIQDLRYGENPHQKAAFYKYANQDSGIVLAKQIQGKELSYNNIMDTDAAWGLAKEFMKPACVIVKHTNPCGTAMGQNLHEAFLRARQGDPVSSFGGIVALNEKVDKETAVIMAETFFEVIIAPGYDDDALAVFSKKKNLRILSLDHFSKKEEGVLNYRFVRGGMLVQEQDLEMLDVSDGDVVTKRMPTPKEWDDLNFAWKVVKHVKSNAIVYSQNEQILGVGAGQMSRVDSVKIAGVKMKETGITPTNLVMASDAFFPFRDGVDEAAKLGIKAIVQPGGSVRDKEVIEACDELGIAMVLTGMRHFKH